MANDPTLLFPKLVNPLSSRLATLPIILAGPILRHVNESSVTVWIALRSAHQVNLQVFTLTSTTPVMQSSFTSALKVGENLYVIAVTASAATAVLSAGQNYTYNIQFKPTGSSQTFDLFTSGYWFAGNPSNGKDASVAAKISYGSIGMPSFALPPASMNDLKVVFGSCRKPHGDSVDALETLDALLANTHPPNGPGPATNPVTRPHHLLFTGDQIYADDVAHILLALLTDAATVLLGAPELLPTLSADGTPGETKRFGPATRDKKIANEAGFTSTANNSHLMSFGEYAAMYLFAYSDVLWPSPLPAYEEVFRTGTEANPGTLPKIQKGTPYWAFAVSENQRKALESFVLSLPNVRRALANVPIYMIIDDHDVTDDWLMNRQFCDQVLPTELGTRIMMNALAAYAWFQAWGNVGKVTGAQDVTPALVAFQAWQQNDYPVADQTVTDLKKILGMPLSALGPATPPGVAQLAVDTAAVKWSYALSWATHELIVVDSRTRRGYPTAPLASPALIAETDQAGQLGIPLPPGLEDKVSIVVAPGPLVGIPGLESFQKEVSEKKDVFDRDVEVWSFDGTSLETFVSTLAARGQRQRRVIFIAGDVHYSFAYRYQYWANKPLASPTGGSAAAVFALMTSSAFKNETGDKLSHTRTLHRTGFVVRNGHADKRVNTRLAFNLAATEFGKSGVDYSKTSNGFYGYAAIVDRKVAIIRNLAEEAAFRGDTFEQIVFTRNPDAVEMTSFLHTDDNLRNVTFPPLPDSPADPGLRLSNTIDGLALSTAGHFDNIAPGSEIVGVNNLAVLRFEVRQAPAPNTLFAVQDLWWRADTKANLYAQQKAKTIPAMQPFTQLSVQLTIDTPPSNLKGVKF